MSVAMGYTHTHTHTHAKYCTWETHVVTSCCACLLSAWSADRLNVSTETDDPVETPWRHFSPQPLSGSSSKLDILPTTTAWGLLSVNFCGSVTALSVTEVCSKRVSCCECWSECSSSSLSRGDKFCSATCTLCIVVHTPRALLVARFVFLCVFFYSYSARRLARCLGSYIVYIGDPVTELDLLVIGQNHMEPFQGNWATRLTCKFIYRALWTYFVFALPLHSLRIGT